MEKTNRYIKITSEHHLLNLNLGELIRYKDLVFLFVKREFISKYKQTILGPAWAIIQPLLTTVVFTFVFGNVAGLAECGTVPTFLFYMCGNVAWQFFSGTLTDTSNTFINNGHILGKVYFPRLVMPIAITLNQLISFAIQSILFIVFWIIYLFVPGYSIEPNWFILLIPLLILQMSMLGMGCGVIISACTTKYKDLRFVVGFGVTLWMYGTPVAYSLSIFEKSKLYTLVQINPMTSIIETMRYSLLGEQAGSFNGIYYLISWICTLIIFAIGVMLFNKAERTFADTI